MDEKKKRPTKREQMFVKWYNEHKLFLRGKFSTGELLVLEKDYQLGLLHLKAMELATRDEIHERKRKK